MTYWRFFFILSLMGFAKLKVLDFVFIALSAMVTLLFFLMTGKSSAAGKKILLAKSSKGEYIFPLDNDAEYEVPGLYGNSIIEVCGGKGRFKDSPCPNKTCVQHGFISSAGEWAACLPNDVFILVDSPKKKDLVDAVAN